MNNKDLHIFAEKLKNFKNSLKSAVFGAINNDLPYISDMNTENLKIGLGSDGKLLPDYSETSVKKYGKPAGAIKLHDTGEFYSGINAKLFDNTLQIVSNSDKFLFEPANLAWRFGDDIVGLTAANISEVENDIIGTAVNDFLNEYFNSN